MSSHLEAAIDAPARRTRPRNRRAITLDAAAALFYRNGYADVSMSDIAEATNVGPSAIYRHFRSKADLLVAAIEASVAPYLEFLAAARVADNGSPLDLPAISILLAECGLDNREFGVLWQRDARNLDEQQRRVLRDQLRATAGLLASFITDRRPELGAAGVDALAWCALGVVESISFHSLTLPRTEFVALLAELVMAVALVPVPCSVGAESERDIAPAETPVPAKDGEADAVESRREQLVTVAAELFAERGFSAVGVDDIAEAAGIAGPSVYAHFPSKLAILSAAIDRAAGLARRDSERVLASGGSPQQKLAELALSYTRLVNRDRFIIRTLMSEMDRLPADDRDVALGVQREFVDTWVDLRRQFSTEQPLAAEIRVQAVLRVVNDAAQTPHLRALPGFEATLARVAAALLDL